MPADPTTFDPAIQSEDIAFQADELVGCGKCGRSNPPNRLECIYCGAALVVDPDQVGKTALRKLEPWEPGWNIVITGGSGDNDRAAEFLSLDPEQFAAVVASPLKLPVARLDENAAAVAGSKLADLGFATRVISDEELLPAKLPARLSGMSLKDDGVALRDFNTGMEEYHSWNDLVLIVSGSFSTGKIETMEKRRRKGTSVIAETTTSADEPVFDLYTADDPIGCRVQLSGFDYSSLGERMAPLATENMTRLVDLLGSRSPQIKVIDDYKRIRHLLVGVWDVESRKDPQGLKQVGFGKREFGVVHSTNNVEQFTRFSRLQRLML